SSAVGFEHRGHIILDLGSRALGGKIVIIDVPRTTVTSSHKARWIALVVVCLGQLMSIVDASIVNVALPPIQRSLHFSQANLTWVVNAYLISYGSLLLSVRDRLV